MGAVTRGVAALIAIALILPAQAQIPQATTDHIPPNYTIGLPTTGRYGKASDEHYWVHGLSRKRGLQPLVLWLPDPGWRHSDPNIDTGQMASLFDQSDIASGGMATKDPKYAGVRETTAEIATAIAAIRKRSADTTFDPDRLIIIGRGAAAYYAMLLVTQPNYLAAVGIDPHVIRGVVLITPDGAFGPDQVIANSKLSDNEAERYFGKADGRDDLVPVLDHLSVKAFLLFSHHLSRPADLQRLSDMLSAHGATVETQPVLQTITGVSKTYLGSSASIAARQIVDFVNKVGSTKP